MTTHASRHTETTALLLSKARAHLDAGDLSRASEKGWEAAAWMLDAAAEQRGWEHTWHGDYFKTVGRIADELGDKELRRMFFSADALNQNIYENWMPAGSVAVGLNAVERFVRRLDDALA